MSDAPPCHAQQPKRAHLDASTLTRPRLPRPRRLLAALSDERLAVEAKRGNDAAFEVIYERHHRGLLSFCRHTLRSQEDGEDALQQTFASAFRALPDTKQPILLKPWLYTIARNRCLSMLRARREFPSDELEIGSSTAGLSEEVEQREELRELLSNVEDLPEDQRAALVLSEIGDLGHPEIAQVLDCETKQVKALVFQARSALIEDRRAREIPCAEIREQLATASAGELRRSSLRRHVRVCSGCAEFRDEVRRQRGMLALALPVIPSLGLKESALAAAGIGGGGGAAGGGLIAALGAHGAAKVAAVAIAAGGTVGGSVAATDPSLVARAQTAVERVANELGIVATPSSTGPGDNESGTDKASGSFDWEGVPAAAQRQTKPEGKANRGPVGEGARGPDQGRGAAGEGGRGQGHAYGRTREGSGPDGVGRGQGEQGAAARGKSNGSSPQGGGDRAGQEASVPRLGTGGGAKPGGSLPRREEDLRTPADELLERGKRSVRGLGRGD